MVRAADIAAQALDIQLHLMEARGPEAFNNAFVTMTRAPTGALLVLGDAMFLQHCSRLADLTAVRHLPVMYAARLFSGWIWIRLVCVVCSYSLVNLARMLYSLSVQNTPGDLYGNPNDVYPRPCESCGALR
jgi:hypothetical protein